MNKILFFLAISLPMFILSSCSKADDGDNLIGWYYNNQTTNDTTHDIMYQYAMQIVDDNTMLFYNGGLSRKSWAEKGYECLTPVNCSLGTWYARTAPCYCSYYIVDKKLYAPMCHFTIWTITSEGLVPDGLIWGSGASPVFVKK